MIERSQMSLAPYTSLRVGGPAEHLVETDDRGEVIDVLRSETDPVTILGFGCNSLVSDEGIPGVTVVWRGGEIEFNGTSVVVDAGVLWDDLVDQAVRRGLWGLELTSEIPGSAGAAVFGNVAAYGQQACDRLDWVEVFDRADHRTRIISQTAIRFGYRESSLSVDRFYVTRLKFNLQSNVTHPLEYGSALSVAKDKGLDPRDLEQRRAIILEARQRAGAIYRPDEPESSRTAGSFFRNPLVQPEVAAELAARDETGRTLESILEQNKVHGGSRYRASAAHVLLAAGFYRGQRWGNVRLHPAHVLKVQTLEGATASEVFAVTQAIAAEVKKRLGVLLVPEVSHIGTFQLT